MCPLDLCLPGAHTRALQFHFALQPAVCGSNRAPAFRPDWMLQGKLPDNATVNPAMYDVLAAYYSKYIEAYSSHGVHIDFLEAFNEPYDSYTHMTAAQLARFLGRHLGPLFEKRGLWPRTRLTYGGQCARTSAAQFIPAVMADKDAAKYMDVLAYHGYDCQFEDDGSCDDMRQNYSAIAKLAKAFPGRPLWMTEICYAYNGDDPHCTSSATMDQCTDYPRDPKLAPPLPRRDFADGSTWGHRLVKEVEAGASGWIYWNLLLDTRGGPFALSPRHGDASDNYQQPLVVVDAAKATFYPTGLFYFLAHFARFVRPGAVRLGYHSVGEVPPGVSLVPFEDPSGHGIVLQMVNRDSAAQHVAVCSGGRVADVVLPPKSITTATWGRASH